MIEVFISYRRSDARADAGRLADRLMSHFGDEHVFMDVDDIGPGEDFAEILDATLNRATAMLVVIGPHWLEASASDGARRLDDPNDVVRMEVQRALDRAIAVIPVLVGGAEIPAPADLPEALRPLGKRQAVRISHANFHADVDGLLEVLEMPTGVTWRLRRWIRRPRAVGLIALSLIAAVFASVLGGWLYDRMVLRRQVQAHLDVAEAFLSDNRLRPALTELGKAKALAPDEVTVVQRLAGARLEMLEREAYLGSGIALDIALNRRYARLRPVPESEVDDVMGLLFQLAVLRPDVERDAAHWLSRARAQKTSGARVSRAVEALEQAQRLAPEDPRIRAELGLMKAVVEGDERGLELLRSALADDPGSARTALYLGRALSELNECSSARDSRQGTGEPCADAVRGYDRAMTSAAAGASNLWSRHIRRSAGRGVLDILRQFSREDDGIKTKILEMPLPERIEILERLTQHEDSLRRSSWTEGPQFWLALLYEATGQRARARQVLEALMSSRDARPDEWQRLYDRLR